MLYKNIKLNVKSCRDF